MSAAIPSTVVSVRGHRFGRSGSSTAPVRRLGASHDGIAIDTGAVDGRALRLRLDAKPNPGPVQGVTVATGKNYGFGRFGTRMKAADCTGQNRPGVVTGIFTYSVDHSDANRNGLPDNDEIDIEILCAQPNVVWLTLWTDYDELKDVPRSVSRAIDLRTGQVLRSCYVTSWESCQPLRGAENQPASVTPLPGFDSGRQYHSYQFDRQRNRVTFSLTTDAGKTVTLWDYRGPVSRIPGKPSQFMQNVWHTRTWSPLDGPATNQPTVATSAYVDSSTLPRS